MIRELRADDSQPFKVPFRLENNFPASRLITQSAKYQSELSLDEKLFYQLIYFAISCECKRENFPRAKMRGKNF